MKEFTYYILVDIFYAPENWRFSDVFRGYRPLARKGLEKSINQSMFV